MTTSRGVGAGNPRKLPLAARALVAVLVFLGVSGLFGGGAFIVAPDGHLIKAPASWLEQIPFSDFLIPGLLLFVVVGVLPLLVAASLLWRPELRPLQRITPFKDRYWGWAAAGVAGFGIIIFEIVELVLIPFGWLHAVYLGTGAAIVLLALSGPVRRYYRLVQSSKASGH